MTGGRMTVFTSEWPKALGKVFSLASGSLKKETAGSMSRGKYRVASFSTPHDLAALLKTVGHDQAISASLPLGASEGSIVSERHLAATPGAITRSKRSFGLPDAPGILTLDYDPQEGRPPLTSIELPEALLKACPGLARAGIVHWHSGSSFIFHGDRQLKGIGGQRLYVMVQSLADVPRALATLNKRLWLAGIGGHVKVSAAGSLLVRSLFDGAMGDAGARLDFIGGSICRDGLEQRRGDPTVVVDGDFIDSHEAIPDVTPDEDSAYEALVETAKHNAAAEADAKRREWKAEKEREAVAQAVTLGANIEDARVQVRRTLDAALGGSLLGSFALIHVDDLGKESSVTVDQVLSDRARWHLSRFLSPIDPDHRDRSPDAILYADQPHPVLYDLNDGGTLYRLLKQPVSLCVTPGSKSDLAGQISDHLKQEPDIFTSGGQLVRVSRGALVPMSRPLLSYLIGCKVALYRQGREKRSPIDIDQSTADMVSALLTERARAIMGRASIPLICTDGRVIHRPGFDEPTALYVDLEPGTLLAIPDAPRRIETIEALRRLWHPWSSYQWATPHDRAAMLATVLTIAIRPTIEAAPGLFADAPLQASGKSKAVAAVAAVVRGHSGGVKSWVAGNDAEVEKYLLSVVRAGEASVTFDNILGTFDSAALATSMTEGRVSARLLGVSELKSHAARIMWLASGNNAVLSRDQATRWLVARIDTKSEAPHKLSFSFDPVEAALRDRLGIARAIVVVHRAWHTAGCPRGDGINTRFAEWGRVVRSIVQWLQTTGIAVEAGIGALGDPATSILEGACTADPETDSLALLLYGLSETFGCDPFTSAEVASHFKDGETSAIEGKIAIWEGITGLMPRARYGATSQSVGSVLRNRRDRPTLGLKLVEVPQFGRAAARGSMWRVVSA